MRGERIEAWARTHSHAVDTALAAVLLALAVVFGRVVHAEGPYFLFTTLLLVPLVVRRRWPVWCLAATALVALAQWLTVRGTVGAVPADVAVPLAVHAVAAYGPRWASRAGLFAGLVGAVLGGVEWPRLRESLVAHLVIGAFLASMVIAAWAVGTMQRLRRSQVDAQRELAVLAERARIAREMHDVVAHSLAVVIAQADGGRYAAAAPAVGDGARAEDTGVDGAAAAVAALETIGAYARQALGDTRRILGVLRDDPQQPVEPVAGLGDVAELVERVRGSGWDVGLAVEVGSVDPG
ncbi:two-component sensor histidine kinase, partial [Kribbella antibiotica]